MSKPIGKVSLTPLDDIFGASKSEERGDNETTPQYVPLDMLHPFRGHPYQVRDDESMLELVDSIKHSGVLCPVIVRPRAEGGYEMVSGHRRKRACELAGMDSMPVDIRDVDDDTAILMMVGTNCQREKVLPSEKGFAYKMMMDAMRRTAGRPKHNASQVGTNIRSDTLLQSQVGESRNQIQRYIRLTELIHDLLAQVDSGALPFNTGVELSYLKHNEQQTVLDTMISSRSKPTIAQANQLKEHSQSGVLTKETIISTLISNIAQAGKVSIPAAELRKYFPATYTTRQIYDIVLNLLEEWSRGSSSE